MNWLQRSALWWRTLWLHLSRQVPDNSMLGSKALNLSDAEIHALPLDHLPQIPPHVLSTWKSGQLDALSLSQFRALSGEQIGGLLSNHELHAEHLHQLVRAIATAEDHAKFADIVHYLGVDREGEPKLYAILDAIEHDLTIEQAKDALLMFCRKATDEQFSVLLTMLPFAYIRVVSWQELDHPNPAECERLELRVEERQIRNSAELMRLTQDVRALEQAFYGFTQGTPIEIEPSSRPWRWISDNKLKEFNELMDQGLGHGQRVARASGLMAEMSLEITQKQAHLQMQNCRVSAVLDLWNYEYLTTCFNQLQILSKILRPQFVVVEQIAQILEQRGAQPLSDEERAALLSTAHQGVQLVEVMEREVQKAKKLLIQLSADSSFLEQSLPIFLDNIRHETGVGRFSAEFFRRVQSLKDTDQDAFHILHGEEFEELIAEHPDLSDAMKLLEGIIDLKVRVQTLHEALTDELSKLDTGPVGARIISLIETL